MPARQALPSRPVTAPMAFAERWREILFLLVILVFWITNRPYGYSGPPEPGESSSDLLNQLTFLALAGACGFALMQARARALMPLLQLSYGLVLLALFVSLGQSLAPADAFRALAFTLIAIFLVASLFLLPRDAGRFRHLLFWAAAITVAMAWFGVIALPDIAIHSDVDAFEPEHAGSWRGHFTHKNIAGAMMAILALIGVYAVRSGERALGWGIVVGALVFLWFTRSKTSFGLLPAVVILVFLAERIPWLWARLVLLVGPVLALNVLTLGSALFPGIAEFNRGIMKDPSFTGRFDIWRFGFEKLAERPWTGFGYESFWMTDLAKYAESKLELAWLVGGIVHGHNSYLDMAIALGWPGACVVIWALAVKPVLDFHRCRDTAENRLLAGTCIMIWQFVALCSCLEVFFFRRADPIWATLLIAIFGLRLAATHRLAEPRTPADRT